ncbi:FliM/FliN family flagellar motor C-terminal domain-containing protein [Pseudomonas sp. EA_35y_Pfl2_R111]|uniref:FliM/FliN family flagellar motor C-terminal domain-containing protein n=1 Tax=Pseudomonas sp. EA_35y_Pfl2_R111 TaxID=3088689 RepID=UPI0030D78895
MRRLGFLGKSRLDAASKLFPEAVANWRAQWCFVDEQVPWLSQCSDETALAKQEAVTSLAWQKAQGRAGSIWLAGQQPDAWRQLLFGVHAKNIPEDATARHLLVQAQLALVNALLAELQQAPFEDLVAEAPNAPGGLYSDRLLLNIAGPDTQLYVLLDAALLEQHLPSLPTLPALVNRQAAIGKAKIKLHVRLPLASLALGEMNDLQAGDILRARTELAQPLRLTTEQAKVVAEGYLARHQDHLALQLTK